MNDLGIFDKAVLMSSVEEATLGAHDPRALLRLDAALSAIAWLTQGQRSPIQWQQVVRVPSHRRDAGPADSAMTSAGSSPA
jgi:hypothetical protein